MGAPFAFVALGDNSNKTLEGTPVGLPLLGPRALRAPRDEDEPGAEGF